MTTRSRGLVFFLIIILVIPIISCSSQEPGSEGAQEQSPSESGEDLPEVTGDEIEILETATYQDEFGYWHLHGLLTNTADYPVGGFALEVQIGGSPVIEAYSDGAFGIAPGATQPFSARLPLTVTQVDDLEIKVLNLQRISLKPVQIEIVQSRLSVAENGLVTLVGEVQNSSSTPGLVYSARSGLYTQDGTLFTTASCQICPGYLPPGEKAPVQFLFYGHPANVDFGDHEIFVAADEASYVEGLTIDFGELVHTYTDPAGGFHVLGELQNNADMILALALTGTFYDQNGEILGASAYTLPADTLPGETSPYALIIDNPGEPVADWSIRIELALTRERRTPVYPLANIGGVTEKDQYQWSVAGSTVNDSDQTLRLVTVVVGLRETGTGKLVGLAQQILAGEIPPGESVDYNVIINPDPAIDPEVLEEFVILIGE